MGPLKTSNFSNFSPPQPLEWSLSDQAPDRHNVGIWAVCRYSRAIGYGLKPESLGRFSDLAETQEVVTSTSTCDDLNRITALDHSHGSTSITGYGFTYDVGSRMTAIDFTKLTHNAEDATWTGQLTSANRCGTGALQNHLTSDSFGRIKAESNAAVDYLFGYAGIERDEKTGLDRADHRYYDSGMQRWITEDPTGFGGGDKNVLRNVGNGTTNWIDPSGLIFDDPGWQAFIDQEGKLVMQLNRMFGTKHAAMHYFDAAERKMIEQALERQVDWDGFLMKWGNAV